MHLVIDGFVAAHIPLVAVEDARAAAYIVVHQTAKSSDRVGRVLVGQQQLEEIERRLRKLVERNDVACVGNRRSRRVVVDLTGVRAEVATVGSVRCYKGSAGATIQGLKCWNRSRASGADLLAYALVIGKEEGMILPDRTAHRPAVLILQASRIALSGAKCERILGQVRIAFAVVKQGAVEAIGAGLGLNCID